MAFDDPVRIAVQRDAFHDVRVNRPLPQEGRMDFRRGFGKYFNKFMADDLAFPFGVAYTLQFVQETVRGINVFQVHFKIAGKDFLNQLRFIFTQQPVVDEHTGQLVPDRFMNQSGHHGGINAAAQAEDDFFVAHPIADVFNRFIDKRIHPPTAGTAAFLAESAHGVDVGNCNTRFAPHFRRGPREQHRNSQPGERRQCGRRFRRGTVRTDDQPDRFFFQQPGCRHGIRHDHGVNMFVADGAGDFLNVFAAEVQ